MWTKWARATPWYNSDFFIPKEGCRNTAGFIKQHNLPWRWFKATKHSDFPSSRQRLFSVCLYFHWSVLPLRGSPEYHSICLLLKDGVTKNLSNAIDPFTVDSILHDNGGWKTPLRPHWLATWLSYPLELVYKTAHPPHGREVGQQLAMLSRFCACALTLFRQKL